jgi:DNA replication protein DnaC
MRLLPPGDPQYGKAITCPKCNAGHKGGIRHLQGARLNDELPDIYKQMHLHNFVANIPEYTPQQNWDLAAALKQSTDFCDQEEGWLYIQGACGSGKTHLAAAISNVWAAQGHSVIFSTVPDMLDYLRVAYAPTSEQTYDVHIDNLMNCSHLVLDDLGAENASPWAREKLYQILNQRYIYRYLTIITSNVPPTMMEERLLSRLSDEKLVKQVKLHIPDYRSQNDPYKLNALGLSNPQLYKGMTFDTYRTDLEGVEGLSEVKSTLNRYLEKQEGWLILIGAHGAGKTHAAAAIAHQWDYFYPGRVLQISAPAALDFLRAPLNMSNPNNNALNTVEGRLGLLSSIPFLALDDMNITDSTSAWAREKLQQLLDARYLMGLPTIVGILPDILRRLHENGDPIYSRIGDTRHMHWLSLPKEDLRRRRWHSRGAIGTGHSGS